MFGKRTSFGGNTPGVGEVARPIPSPPRAAPAAVVAAPDPVRRPADDGMAMRAKTTDDVLDVRAPADVQRDREYFQTKSAIFNALIDSIDLSQLATMESQAAREE